MTWTDFQLQAINHLGELRYTTEQISTQLGLDELSAVRLRQEMRLPNSIVRIAYDSGVAQADYCIDRRLQQACEDDGDADVIDMRAHRIIMRELDEERAFDWAALVEEKDAIERENLLMIKE